MNASDPFASPLAMAAPAPQVDERARVLVCAQGQRNVILMILASLAMLPMSRMIGALGVVMLALFQLAFVILMAVVVFRTTRAMYGSTGRAVVYALFSWVPLVGLILLVTISSTATNLLRKHGFKVGLLGADMAKVKAWAAQSGAPPHSGATRYPTDSITGS